MFCSLFSFNFHPRPTRWFWQTSMITRPSHNTPPYIIIFNNDHCSSPPFSTPDVHLIFLLFELGTLKSLLFFLPRLHCTYMRNKVLLFSYFNWRRSNESSVEWHYSIQCPYIYGFLFSGANSQISWGGGGKIVYGIGENFFAPSCQNPRSSTPY